MSSTKIQIVIVGAGNRGFIYATYALENPDECQVVGVAEHRDIPRNHMKKLHGIQDQYVFTDWRDMIKVDKFADAVVIATQDQEHVEPALAFAKAGYHILLEKPMAVTEKDCKDIVDQVKQSNVYLAIGHVLRYTPMTKKVKEMVVGDVIGEILNVQHVEPVGFQHFVHSYVRGNWSIAQKSSFMLMTKSCHDIDWIRYIMGESAVKMQSYGALKYFNKQNKPKNAGTRCLDCAVESTCCYSAKKIYLEPTSLGKPTYHILPHGKTVDIENLTSELETGPYGRCVYDHDNDVVDNQVVIMEFKSKATATFTMISATKDVCIRKTRIFGTKGQLEIDGGVIDHYDFLTQKHERIVPQSTQPLDSKMTNHEGADWHLMNSWVAAITKQDPSLILSGPDESLESHLMVFNAEKSRIENNKE